MEFECGDLERALAISELMPEARRLGHKTDWAAYSPPRPQRLGVMAFPHYPLAELVPYIDWGPFFQAWELSGPYPRILEDPVVGSEARKQLSIGPACLFRRGQPVA